MISSLNRGPFSQSNNGVKARSGGRVRPLAAPHPTQRTLVVECPLGRAAHVFPVVIQPRLPNETSPWDEPANGRFFFFCFRSSRIPMVARYIEPTWIEPTWTEPAWLRFLRRTSERAYEESSGLNMAGLERCKDTQRRPQFPATKRLTKQCRESLSARHHGARQRFFVKGAREMKRRPFSF